MRHTMGCAPVGLGEGRAALGYVYLLKAYVSDGFYRIRLRPTDATKLGLIFPAEKGKRKW